MAAPAPPGAPRPNQPLPSSPTNSCPNRPNTDLSLSQNFQNLQINQPSNAFPSSSSLSSLTAPFPASAATPIGNFPAPSPVTRPGAPPPGVVPRAVVLPSGPTQNAVPPNAAPVRPSTGSFAGRPPPFAPRPSPYVSTPSSRPLGPPFQTQPPALPGSQVMHPPSTAHPPPPFTATGPVPPVYPAAGPVSNGTPGALPGAPPQTHFISSGVVRPSLTEPQGPPSMTNVGPFSQAPAVSSFPGSVRPVPPSYRAAFPVSNGIPGLPVGTLPGAVPETLSQAHSILSGGVQSSLAEPLGPPSMPAVGPFSQAPAAGSFPGNVRASSPGMIAPQSSLQPVPRPPPGGSFPPSGFPFGVPPWQTQPRQVIPQAGPDAGQPPRMLGMPPPLPSQHMAGMPPSIGQTGTLMSSSWKLDPNEMPRPSPSASVILHETRQGNQANPPPPATSEYIVRDTGNCSPRYMRCTINQIPCTEDLLAMSGMQLALLVQPLALPHPAEEPIQTVDFGESGPVRCSRCKGYINPFMKFVDQGRRFICNLCGSVEETPHDYHCNLGADGRRRDADDRPELSRGTVEFIASKEFMVRDPMPPVFFFLIDVSSKAIQTGATAVACSAINQVIGDLPEGPRTMVGIATFDSTIHFYNLKRALQQPLMLIVPDVQDVYTPLESDVVVQLSECREHLELLLETIPTMYATNATTDSAFGAATKAASLVMKSTGGKLLVFQSVLPSIGIGALSARDTEGGSIISAGEKESQKLLQPADKTMTELAMELAEWQVCVDVFITSQSYVDIASIAVVPRTTGGQIYYYYPFSSVCDTAKLYNDVKWNVTRPQGFEAVMRVRCSKGIQVQEYSGNYCKRIPTDVDLPGIDCDKTIMVTLKHDDKLQDGSQCAFQCALLYTTVYGQRRIRVINLSLPCTNTLNYLFRLADVDTQLTYFLKQAAVEIAKTPLVRVREQVISHCTNILHAFRRYCSSVTTSGHLTFPETLKLLPLYVLALSKSTGLRTDGRIDDRSFWINYVSSLSAPLAVPLVHPRMISIHDLMSEELDEPLIPSTIRLSSEHVSDEGIYLLENGIDALVYVGSSVDPHVVQQVFGVSLVEEIPMQFVLQRFDNPLSNMFNEVVDEIRRQRCSYLRMKLCKKGDPSGMLFFSYMVEDKTPTGLSYTDFMVYIHRQIQIKLN